MTEHETKVELLLRVGATDEEIADSLQISLKELTRDHEKLLERGRANFRINLRSMQVIQAHKGERAMLIHLGKCVLGQGDRADKKSELSDSTNAELEKDVMVRGS